MMTLRTRHSRLFKTVATGVVCLFLANSTLLQVSYAYPIHDALKPDGITVDGLSGPGEAIQASIEAVAEIMEKQDTPGVTPEEAAVVADAVGKGWVDHKQWQEFVASQMASGSEETKERIQELLETLAHLPRPDIPGHTPDVARDSSGEAVILICSDNPTAGIAIAETLSGVAGQRVILVDNDADAEQRLNSLYPVSILVNHLSLSQSDRGPAHTMPADIITDGLMRTARDRDVSAILLVGEKKVDMIGISDTPTPLVVEEIGQRLLEMRDDITQPFAAESARPTILVYADEPGTGNIIAEHLAADTTNRVILTDSQAIAIERLGSPYPTSLVVTCNTLEDGISPEAAAVHQASEETPVIAIHGTADADALVFSEPETKDELCERVRRNLEGIQEGITTLISASRAAGTEWLGQGKVPIGRTDGYTRTDLIFGLGLMLNERFGEEEPLYDMDLYDTGNINVVLLADLNAALGREFYGLGVLTILPALGMKHRLIPLSEVVMEIWDNMPDEEKSAIEGLGQIKTDLKVLEDIALRAHAIFSDVMRRARSGQFQQLIDELAKGERLLISYNMKGLPPERVADLDAAIRRAFPGIKVVAVIPYEWRDFQVGLRDFTEVVWDNLPPEQRNEPGSAVQVALQLEPLLEDFFGKPRLGPDTDEEPTATDDFQELDPVIAGVLEVGAPEAIETHIAALTDEAFTELAQAVDTWCPYDAIMESDAWDHLQPPQQAVVRAVAERELRESCRYACELLFWGYVSVARTIDPGQRGPQHDMVRTLGYMPAAIGRSVFDLLKQTPQETFDQAMVFEQEFTAPPGAETDEPFTLSVLGNTIILEPVETEAGTLDFAEQRHAVRSLLNRIGSRTQIYIRYGAWYIAQGVICLDIVYGRGDYEDGVFIMEEEWVRSPDFPLAILGVVADGLPLVLFSSLKDACRLKYLSSLTGQDVLIYPYATQSQEGHEVRKWLTRQRGVYSAEALTEDKFRDFFEVAKERLKRHERGHVLVNTDLGWTENDYAVGSESENGTMLFAGNGFGNTLYETMAEFHGQGSYSVIPDMAAANPDAMSHFFYNELAEAWDAVSGGASFTVSPDEALFRLAVFLSCVGDEGQIDFERFGALRERAYDVLVAEFENYRATMAPHLEDFMGANMQSEEAGEFTSAQQDETYRRFFAAVLPDESSEFGNDISRFVAARAESFLAAMRPRFLLAEAEVERAAGQPLVAANHLHDAIGLDPAFQAAKEGLVIAREEMVSGMPLGAPVFTSLEAQAMKAEAFHEAAYWKMRAAECGLATPLADQLSQEFAAQGKLSFKGKAQIARQCAQQNHQHNLAAALLPFVQHPHEYASLPPGQKAQAVEQRRYRNNLTEAQANVLRLCLGVEQVAVVQPTTGPEADPLNLLLSHAGSEPEIDSFLDGLGPVQFEIIHERVAAEYPMQSLTTTGFIGNLGDNERLAIRKVLEKDLVDRTALFCDHQFLLILDSLRNRLAPGEIRPEDVQRYILGYMRLKTGLGIAEAIKMGQATLEARLSVFEEEIRQEVGSKKQVALRILDTRPTFASPVTTARCNGILRQLGSSLRMSGGLGEQNLPYIMLGEGREVDNVTIFTREIVPSPIMVVQQFSAWQGNYMIFAKEAYFHDNAIEYYYSTKGSGEVGNNIALAGITGYAAPCAERILDSLEVADEQDFLERCLPIIIDVNMEMGIAHERSHIASIDTKFHSDAGLHNSAMELGNRFGTTLEESVVELSDEGPIAYITRLALAEQDTQRASVALWCRLAHKVSAADPNITVNPEIGGILFTLPALLHSTVTAQGEIDFQQLEQNRADLYQYLDGCRDLYLDQLVRPIVAGQQPPGVAQEWSEDARRAVEAGVLQKYPVPDTQFQTLQEYAQHSTEIVLARTGQQGSDTDEEPTATDDFEEGGSGPPADEPARELGAGAGRTVLVVQMSISAEETGTKTQSLAKCLGNLGHNTEIYDGNIQNLAAYVQANLESIAAIAVVTGGSSPLIRLNSGLLDKLPKMGIEPPPIIVSTTYGPATRGDITLPECVIGVIPGDAGIKKTTVSLQKLMPLALARAEGRTPDITDSGVSPDDASIQALMQREYDLRTVQNTYPKYPRESVAGLIIVSIWRYFGVGRFPLGEEVDKRIKSDDTVCVGELANLVTEEILPRLPDEKKPNPEQIPIVIANMIDARLRECGAVEVGQPAGASGTVAVAKTRAGPTVILVVFGEHATRVAAQYGLQAGDRTIVQARNTEDATFLLKNQKFDLIVTDIENAEDIIERNPNIPVIVLISETGSSAVKTAERKLMQLGAAAVVSLDTGWETLGDSVTKTLARADGAVKPSQADTGQPGPDADEEPTGTDDFVDGGKKQPDDVAGPSQAGKKDWRLEPTGPGPSSSEVVISDESDAIEFAVILETEFSIELADDATFSILGANLGQLTDLVMRHMPRDEASVRRDVNDRIREMLTEYDRSQRLRPTAAHVPYKKSVLFVQGTKSSKGTVLGARLSQRHYDVQPYYTHATGRPAGAYAVAADMVERGNYDAVVIELYHGVETAAPLLEAAYNAAVPVIVITSGPLSENPIAVDLESYAAVRGIVTDSFRQPNNVVADLDQVIRLATDITTEGTVWVEEGEFDDVLTSGPQLARTDGAEESSQVDGQTKEWPDPGELGGYLGPDVETPSGEILPSYNTRAAYETVHIVDGPDKLKKGNVLLLEIAQEIQDTLGIVSDDYNSFAVVAELRTREAVTSSDLVPLVKPYLPPGTELSDRQIAQRIEAVMSKHLKPAGHMVLGAADLATDWHAPKLGEKGGGFPGFPDEPGHAAASRGNQSAVNAALRRTGLSRRALWNMTYFDGTQQGALEEALQARFGIPRGSLEGLWGSRRMSPRNMARAILRYAAEHSSLDLSELADRLRTGLVRVVEEHYVLPTPEMRLDAALVILSEIPMHDIDNERWDVRDGAALNATLQEEFNLIPAPAEQMERMGGTDRDLIYGIVIAAVQNNEGMSRQQIRDLANRLLSVVVRHYRAVDIGLGELAAQSSHRNIESELHVRTLETVNEMRAESIVRSQHEIILPQEYLDGFGPAQRQGIMEASEQSVDLQITPLDEAVQAFLEDFEEGKTARLIILTEDDLNALDAEVRQTVLDRAERDPEHFRVLVLRNCNTPIDFIQGIPPAVGLGRCVLAEDYAGAEQYHTLLCHRGLRKPVFGSATDRFRRGVIYEMLPTIRAERLQADPERIRNLYYRAFEDQA